MKRMKINHPKLFLKETLARLRKSKLFLRNFLLLFSIISIMFLSFSAYAYRQSLSTLEKELIGSSESHLEVYTESIDTNIKELRRIYATLEITPMIQAYCNNPLSEILYADLQGQIRNMLLYYVQGNSAIDSIYIYSGRNQAVLTNSWTDYPIHNFTDGEWISKINDENMDKLQMFFRSKNRAYPYLLSIMKAIDTDPYKSAIIINVDFKNLSALKEFSKNQSQSIYIVSDDSMILYRHQQEALLEELEVVPELEHFQADAQSHSCLISDQNGSYVFAQMHSDKYPWSYVTVTYLGDYAAHLSSTQALIVSLMGMFLFLAVFLAFGLSYHAVKPVHGLLAFIQEPSQVLAADFFSTSEIQEIADSIISSMQMNQTLSAELEKRLRLLEDAKLIALQSQINPHFLFNTLNMIHIQECAVLGYDHGTPKLTLALSKLLRYAIDSIDLVDLQTELEYTKLYISILKERYQMLRVIYDIEEDAYAARVPKLFIQPIIENAVFHGLSKSMNENSTLTLSCKTDGDFCYVTVTDNGKGINEETLQKLRALAEDTTPPQSSIGLKNVFVRMNLLYKERFSVQIHSVQGEGSSFILRFPLTIGQSAE